MQQADENAELKRAVQWATEVFFTRRRLVDESVIKPEQYEASRKYTYILSILSALLDQTAVDIVELKKRLVHDYAKDYANVDVDRATLIWLMDELINIHDTNITGLTATQCCNHHKMVCNHCACH